MSLPSPSALQRRKQRFRHLPASIHAPISCRMGAWAHVICRRTMHGSEPTFIRIIAKATMQIPKQCAAVSNQCSFQSQYGLETTMYITIKA